jgi:CRISPR-associated protein Csm1
MKKLIYFTISGIQDFIYTIKDSVTAGEERGADKLLRARSFYLELICEQVAQEIRAELGGGAQNIYNAGGNGFFLCEDTPELRPRLSSYFTKLNDWLIDDFGGELYVAFGIGDYDDADFKQATKQANKEASEKKLHRYDAAQMRRINNFDRPFKSYDKECEICRRLGEGKQCKTCNALEQLGRKIQEKSRYFAVAAPAQPTSLRISPTKYLDYTGQGAEELKLDVANYAYRDQSGRFLRFEQLAKAASGIGKLAVLRMDVDNLGAFFIGSDSLDKSQKHSEFLSRFFKRQIVELCLHPKVSYFSAGGEPRRLQIIYSGGDDVFAVGAWSDILDFAVEVRQEFEAYTTSVGGLTLSAGIGLYSDNAPISFMAKDTGALEDNAKGNRKGKKDSIALFRPSNTFTWDEFKNDVLDSKLKVIKAFFCQDASEKGKAFIYRLLSLIREHAQEVREHALEVNDEGRDFKSISVARWAYLLARTEILIANADDNAAYQEFKHNLGEWINSPDDRKQLECALELYVYSIRNREDENE